MPRFAPDPSKVAAGIPVYPKGTYNVVLGEPKSFFKENVEKGTSNHGVRFTGRIKGDAQFENKPFIVTCYMHTEGAESYSKGMQMAALGYNPQSAADDAAFNENHGSDDWTYNTDDNSCGEGWHKMKGQVIQFDLDVGMDANQKEQQKVVAFRPVG